MELPSVCSPAVSLPPFTTPATTPALSHGYYPPSPGRWGFLVEFQSDVSSLQPASLPLAVIPAPNTHVRLPCKPRRCSRTAPHRGTWDHARAGGMACGRLCVSLCIHSCVCLCVDACVCHV